MTGTDEKKTMEAVQRPRERAKSGEKRRDRRTRREEARRVIEFRARTPWILLSWERGNPRKKESESGEREKERERERCGAVTIRRWEGDGGCIEEEKGRSGEVWRRVVP